MTIEGEYYNIWQYADDTSLSFLISQHRIWIGSLGKKNFFANVLRLKIDILNTNNK